MDKQLDWSALRADGTGDPRLARDLLDAYVEWDASTNQDHLLVPIKRGHLLMMREQWEADKRLAYRAGIEAAAKVAESRHWENRNDAAEAIRALPDLTQDAPEGGKTTANGKDRQPAEESGA